MSDDQFLPSFEGTWARLSQVAVKGAEYNSRERQPHPKCLQGTRVKLLHHIYTSSDDLEQSRLIWLHGTAGVGKSAVAFTVAERMRGLKVTEQTKVEKRLAGTFFFSRKHTKRCTTGYFFATLVYQLASNFPSIRQDVNRAIRDNPALLDPDKPLCDQMEALFLQPLRKLRLRLRGCPPLSFVIDAVDECTSEPEVTDLILSLARALREPDLPVTHILLTSRSESHICKAFQNDEVRPLVCEIPVKTSGEGGIISLDGADVDDDICTFLRHSFKELESRHPNFPKPSKDQLDRLASRAGRRFIVASTMMKFIIDDEDNDPHDRLQLMLELTSELLPGTEVYKLYDCILSTCADPKRAYLHLSLVAALVDPLSISQISKLLGPGLGRDVETTLMQLRSVIDIPTNRTLPVNIYHSSIRDYVSKPSNCSLSQVHDDPSLASPHSLLTLSCFRLMMKDIPKSTGLLDALLELNRQSQAMNAEDPRRLKDLLAFLVQPLEPLSIIKCLLWLRGDRSSRYWPRTADGCSWLQTRRGGDWLQTQGGREWLQTWDGQYWLLNQGVRDQGKSRRNALQIQVQIQDSECRAEDEYEGDFLQSHYGAAWLDRGRWDQIRHWRDWLWTPGGQEWLRTLRITLEVQEWLQEWLQTPGGSEWLQTPGVRHWLQTPGESEWLQTLGGREWLQTPGVRHWLQTPGGREWLQTLRGREWLQTPHGRDWLQTPGVRHWLLSPGGREWLQTPGGREWLQTPSVRHWLQTPGGREWLQTPGVRHWLQTPGESEWLQTPGRREWLQTSGGREWLQTPRGREWLQTPHGRDWLPTPGGREWLQTPGMRHWLQISGEREWLQTPGGSEWLQTPGGREWLRTLDGQDWLQTPGGREWLQTPRGRDWLQTPHGHAWQSTPAASIQLTMEEFSSTLGIIDECVIVPESRLLPAFQAVQQFKSFPDFLMFPVFLSLRHPNQHLSMSARHDFCSRSDVEIVHAMQSFVAFANEAQKQSRSASVTLKYACQSWAVHLARAPKPWDDRLGHVFQTFWNGHLLSWLERQWCLKGLRSCLVVLSEAQELAKSCQ